MEVASCKTEPDLTYDSKLSRETLPPQLSHRGSRGVEKKWEEKEVLHRKEKFVSLSLSFLPFHGATEYGSSLVFSITTTPQPIFRKTMTRRQATYYVSGSVFDTL